MTAPTPRTAESRGRAVEDRLTLLERRLTNILPGRLQGSGAKVTDWDEATAAGFYWSESTAGHNPTGGPAVGVVAPGPDGTIVQEVWRPDVDSGIYTVAWRRAFVGDVWTAWGEASGGAPDVVPATEVNAGIARLATLQEARLFPGENVSETIMTPQRVADHLAWFSPAVGMKRTSKFVADWNVTREVGFYTAFSGTVNGPAGVSTALGLVHSGAQYDYNGEGAGPVIQEITEVTWTGSAYALGNKWARVGDSGGAWGAWVKEVDPTVSWDDLVNKPATFPPSPHTHTTAQITDFATATDARINTLVPTASTTAQGKVELATAAEALAGTDTARAVTPAGLKGVADTKAALVHTHTSSQITDFDSAVDARIAGGAPSAVPDATTTVKGKVELATEAEVLAGTDTARAVTPAGVKAVADTKAPTAHTHTWSQITDPPATYPPSGHTHPSSQITDFATATDGRINALVPVASTTAQGKVELATEAEAAAGTDATRAVTPQGLKGVADTKAPLTHTHPASQITDFSTAVPAAVPAATATTQGKVELATPAEALTGTDTTRAVTPQGLKGVADTKAPLVHTHTTSQITDFQTATDARVNALVPTATTSVSGKSELATSAETQAGTDAARVVTPAGLSSRTATEARTGLARLATDAEAILTPTSLDPSVDTANTIMTPDQVMRMLGEFTPVLALGRTSVFIADWNTAWEVGFYKGYQSTLNNPPGQSNSNYLGIVQSTETKDYSGEGDGPVLQTLRELRYNGTIDVVLPGEWTRVGYNGTWGPWESADALETRQGIVRYSAQAELDGSALERTVVTPDDVIYMARHATILAASTTQRGTAELATEAEVLAGTDAQRIVTPATLAAALEPTNLPAASETARGVAELATEAETLAGTDTQKIVTPANLATALADSGYTLPDRLAATSKSPPSSDWNLAVETGFYRSGLGTLNSPITDPVNGFVVAGATGITQTVYPETGVYAGSVIGWVRGRTQFTWWSPWQPIFKGGGTGPESTRDAIYPTPTTDVQRAALANSRTRWYNEDYGWEEMYYAPADLPGLTVQGLAPGCPAGWYPTGRGPEIQVTASAPAPATGGLGVGGWDTVLRNSGGTQWFQRSGFENSDWNGKYIRALRAGRFDVKIVESVINGSGTANFWLGHWQPSGTGYITTQGFPVTLIPSFFEANTLEMQSLLLHPGEFVGEVCNSGALTVHTGNGADRKGTFTVRYVGPPLA